MRGGKSWDLRSDLATPVETTGYNLALLTACTCGRTGNTNTFCFWSLVTLAQILR